VGDALEEASRLCVIRSFQYQGLPKLSYFASKFLNQLGDLELESADPAAFVCRNEADDV
jgi:beta-xylosidase